MVEKKKVGDTHLCGGYVPLLFLQCGAKINSIVIHEIIIEVAMQPNEE